MGFDCMAIAVGLFASTMATWPPNERFTYGFVWIPDDCHHSDLSTLRADMDVSKHCPVLRTASS
jgi:hypothetical protein